MRSLQSMNGNHVECSIRLAPKNLPQMLLRSMQIQQHVSAQAPIGQLSMPDARHELVMHSFSLAVVAASHFQGAFVGTVASGHLPAPWRVTVSQ